MPKIDFGEAPEVQAGDAFLLCSDGLWSYLTYVELAGVLSGHSARAACELLISRARARAKGDGDNISLAILKLSEAPAKPERARRAGS